MNGTQGQGRCTMRCWRMSAIAGAVLTVVLWLFTDWGFLSAVIIGAATALIAGTVLTRMLCTDFSSDQSSQPPVATPHSKPAAPAAAPKPAPAPEPEPEPAPQPVAAPVASAAEDTGSVLKPSKPLPGQAELASRKGSWSYQGAGSSAAPAPSVAPAAEAGGKPATLAAARAEGADNLKLIKGVGPKLEAVLNGVGIYHFDQIADWTAAEVAWADNNLVGFKGRVSRDGWVDQARILAAGGETEFSKRNA